MLPLTEAQQQSLLRLARASMDLGLRGLPLKEPSSPPDVPTECCGAFVTLHKGERLRGCIGHIEALKPLAQTVRECALASALSDPRFERVTADELPDLSAYVRRQHPRDAGVAAWLSRFVTKGATQPTGQLLMTLNEAIAESFSYEKRTSPGTQTPDVTLQTEQGTCRDFALLMMEAARSLGFAARFVTGYIYVPTRDGPVRLGGGSTHAWCQIYVPGSGWVEFDPTNGIVGNRDLIRVGVARTPQQAIPLSGAYWGDADDELGMEVSVNVKTEMTEVERMST